MSPAQPGGGFDLTCRLAQEGLKAAGQLKEPLRIVYMPGGIGAVAYNHVVAQKPDDGSSIIAFSGGSLLNLAQGKFGKYNRSEEHTSELQSLMRISYAVFCLTKK